MSGQSTHRTTYTYPDGATGKQEFNSKEENDAYASVLHMMLAENIVKEFWQPAMGQWVRYHNER